MRKTNYVLLFIGIIAILALILIRQYTINSAKQVTATATERTNDESAVYTPVNQPDIPKANENDDTKHQYIQKKLLQLNNMFVVRGRVLEKGKAIPIPGAVVRCIEEKDITTWFKKYEKHDEADSSLVQIAFTDENGEFSFCVAKGEYLLYAKYSDDSRIEDVKLVKVADEMIENIVLELASYGRIEGYVYSDKNLPLAGAQIVVYPRIFSKLVEFSIKAENSSEISTDSNGKFYIDYLEPLNEQKPIKNSIMYCLKVSHPDFYLSSSVVAVYESKTSFVEIILTEAPPPVSVKGLIIDVNGNPIEGILVEYQLHEPTTFAITQNEIEKKRYIRPGYGGGSPIKALTLGGRSLRSDSSGEFLLELGRPIILSKALLYIIPQNGYAFYMRDISMETEESTLSIEIKLIEGEHIQGFVFDPSGTPLKDVNVSTYIELPETGTLIDCLMTSTDKDGFFDLSGCTVRQTYHITFRLKDSIYEDTDVDITAPAFNQKVFMDKKN